jgi:hypothetical protein
MRESHLHAPSRQGSKSDFTLSRPPGRQPFPDGAGQPVVGQSLHLATAAPAAAIKRLLGLVSELRAVAERELDRSYLTVVRHLYWQQPIIPSTELAKAAGFSWPRSSECRPATQQCWRGSGADRKDRREGSRLGTSTARPSRLATTPTPTRWPSRQPHRVRLE